MDFSALYGHETVKQSLGLAIAQDRVSNAYAFEGLEGVGKKLCAQIFSQALVCKNQHAPCGKCPMCIQAKARTLPDIIYVTKDDDKTQIGVDNIREQIISEAYMKPRCAERKIFIIEQGDLLNAAAQNALLKILEEPPSYVTFIICVTSKEKLLPTVLSRSQTVSFFPLPYSTVAQYLCDNLGLNAESAHILAKLSQGSIGSAISLASDETSKERVEKTINYMLNLKQNSLHIHEMVSFFNTEKENATEIIDYALTFLRDCVMTKTNLEKNIVFVDKLSAIKVFSQDLSKKNLISAYDKLSKLKLSLKQNLNFNATVSEAVMRVWEDFHD